MRPGFGPKRDLAPTFGLDAARKSARAVTYGYTFLGGWFREYEALCGRPSNDKALADFRLQAAVVSSGIRPAGSYERTEATGSGSDDVTINVARR